MPADLTAVRQKLARAKQKLDAVRGHVTTYLDPPPYRLVVESGGDSQAVVCHIDHEPDPDWAHELAEVAYQARSCLDLLARQLAIDSGTPDPRGTQFPIFMKHADYIRKRGRESPRDRHLRGVASRHRRVIDELQPYQRGRRAHDDPLAVLQMVSNRDKHNDIYTAVAAVEKPSFRLVRLKNGVRRLDDLTVDFTGERFRPYAMADSDELVSINTANLEAGYEIRLEIPEMNVDLGFVSDDRVVTLNDIERSVLHVAGIVDRFAGRIKR
jgi:hypothetical protein